MSFWFNDTSRDAPSSAPATGEAGLGDIYRASREQMRLVDNTTGANEALTRAFDRRIAEVQAATGESLQNPMREAGDADRTYTELTAGSTMFMRDAAPELWKQKVGTFNKALADIALRHPDKAKAIGIDRPIEQDAARLAFEADRKLGQALESRDGAGKWAAMLAGAMTGSAYDPMQVGTWAIGGGPGGARTAAMRILTTFMSEAAANAAMEAIQQPQVQRWRAEAGLPNGGNEAASNVLFAGLLGGLLGGGAESLGEFARMALKRAGLPEEIARAETLQDVPQPTARDLLPPEVRGAAEALDSERAIVALRPETTSGRSFDANLSRAIDAAQRNTDFIAEADPERVLRIADQLQPVEGPAAQSQTIGQFLASAGGVRDFKGELKALGLDARRERFAPRLIKEDGLPLDEARKLAAEAGFFADRYGTADIAMEKSTIRDLLDALDQSERDAPRAGDNGRAAAEELAAELTARAGPAVDDAAIVEAARLANAEGLPPAEALDRVLIARDRAAEPAGAAPGEGRPSERNPAERNPADPNAAEAGGVDDPGVAIEDTFFTDADLADLPDDIDIPFFEDGRTLTPGEMKAELDNIDHLMTVVEACRA